MRLAFAVPLVVATPLFLIVGSCPAATLRIADWNVANHPNNADDDQQLKTVLNYAGRIDLLTLAETDTASAPETATDFASAYGGTFASVTGPADGGGDRTGFVYNTAKMTLVSQATIGAGTLTHPTLRAEFRPLGTAGGDDIYVYATHLVSGSSSTIKNQRVAQAQLLRSDIDSLGTANVIVTGDFNWQAADDVSPGVGAYRTFAAAGTGQVTDPLNRVGAWHGNAAYKDLFSEDPETKLDDRFDMQLVSNKLLDGRGVDYTAGSYRVVGNEGTVAPGGTIAASATLPQPVVTALDAFSDHLPVLASYGYRIPGDANDDDTVNFADFLALQNNFGKAAASENQGDFNGDGVTNFADFLILQNNFGASIAGSSTAMTTAQLQVIGAWSTSVPEPAGLIPTLASLVIISRRRRGPC